MSDEASHSAPDVVRPSVDRRRPLEGVASDSAFSGLARRFPLLAVLPPALRICLYVPGSLQLAVVLLSVSVLTLVVATAIEGCCGPEKARSAVYGTEWFALIHLLLGCNVLMAMLIRFPWRLRQIGFLVAHGGVLVLLIGCGLTRWWGIEAQLPVYEGDANRVATIDRGQGDGGEEGTERLELGFQVYLREFRRRLDPGSEMASLYSSRVDFLECSKPPKKWQEEEKLQEDVLITLNEPVDFTDPQTGRTYRLFQSTFDGPSTPGDAQFDQLAGNDRTRDEIYLSLFTLNYDPGRGLKYAGSLLIVLGIGLVYYVRWGGGKGEGAPAEIPLAVSIPLAVLQEAPTGKHLPGLLLAIAVLFSLNSNARAGAEQLDWSAWRHLPTFADGRVMPLDTFARETVAAICGQANPVLHEPGEPAGSPPRRFEAAELLFAWLAEPEKWDCVRLLPADEDLREFLALPTKDADGQRLQGISPSELDDCEMLARRLDDFRRRAAAGGDGCEPSNTEKNLERLLGADGKYRMLTLTRKSSPDLLWWSNARGRRVVDALRRLTDNVQVAKRIAGDAKTRDTAMQVVSSWQRLLGAMHGGGLSREKMEPAVADFCRATEKLAAALATPGDAAVTALGVTLRHQAAELHLAFYGTGKVLRLVPALDCGALEENRTPDDDASPWLSFQAIACGSDALLAAYPRGELQAVCEAFDKAKAAYLNRQATGRQRDFSDAMNTFAGSLRALAEKIEPLRQQLPLRHRDQELINATAYPPPEATDAEVVYNRLDPFFWSWVVSLAATLCLLLAVGRCRRPLFWTGAAILLMGQAFAAVGMVFRWYVTGLLPLTGMFEAVESVAIFSAVLGLWFALFPLLWSSGIAVSRGEQVLDRRLFALAGAIVGFAAAVLAYYAPASVMHRDLGSVTPILRHNRWLAVHVVTIMASYASAAIALILANIALGYFLFGRYRRGGRVEQAESGVEGGVIDGTDETNGTDEGGGAVLRLTHPTICRPPEACRVLGGFTYAAVKITVLLLAAGTIIGGFWADNAWGHFWGWDPKEVGALLALLAYLLILHTRHLGWSGDFGMAVTAFFGFTAILWTWYGVNYMMKSGMHSYGSGAGGKWAVMAVVVIEWLFLLAAAGRRWVETIETH
jgi:ABC-type transport system involved in cytochrome c biogenesis permease subunit